MKQTLRPRDKLRLKSEFSHVRENARKLSSPLALVLAAPSTDGIPRCGVVCGRKFSLKAVERNRARRLLWESFRLLKGRLLPCHLILIPRWDIAGARMQDVMRQLETSFAKGRLLKMEQDSK